MTKKIIFLIIAILVFGAGGFFWWQGREIKGSPEDYVIKETPEGKIVENKKVGLTYKIPQDWILENGNPKRFYSPDTKFKEKSSVFLEKGCKVYVYASYIKTNLDTLQKFIDADFSESSPVIKIDESSTAKVSNYSALRHKYHVEKFGMAYISIDFPAKDKLYRILLSNPIEEKERCEEEFNKFLEVVSVK